MSTTCVLKSESVGEQMGRKVTACDDVQVEGVHIGGDVNCI